jgi:hypothetical protein
MEFLTFIFALSCVTSSKTDNGELLPEIRFPLAKNILDTDISSLLLNLLASSTDAFHSAKASSIRPMENKTFPFARPARTISE